MDTKLRQEVGLCTIYITLFPENLAEQMIFGT